MELSDALLFLGTVAVLLVTVGIGVLTALGFLSAMLILYVGLGLLAIALLAGLVFGVGFLVKKYRERQSVIVEEEPAEEPDIEEPAAEESPAEPEEEPEAEPDYHNIMMDKLLERCMNMDKFLLCRVVIKQLNKLQEQYDKKTLGMFFTEVEKRILKCLSEKDKLYRADDNEYVAVMEEEESSDWKLRIGEIDQIMHGTISFGEGDEKNSIDVSAAIGFAIYPDMSSEPQGLLEIAGLQLEMASDELREMEMAEENIFADEKTANPAEEAVAVEPVNEPVEEMAELPEEPIDKAGESDEEIIEPVAEMTEAEPVTEPNEEVAGAVEDISEEMAEKPKEETSGGEQ